MDTELVPIESVSEDPRNARLHSSRNLEAIKSSLERFGQQKPIVIDAAGVVRAGNGTLRAARELGWAEIAVVRTSLEAAEAVAFAIADNRTGELADWDWLQLADQVRGFDESSALAESWFTQAELERLLAASELVGDPLEEWAGMPAFDNEDRSAARRIVVNFRSDEDVERFGEIIGQKMTKRTRSIWFPAAEIERLMDKRYEEADADPTRA